MGQMRFIVPRRDRLPAGALERAYFCGIEGIPWRARSHWVENDHDKRRGEFVLNRVVDESGNLFIPWYVNGMGELMLSTASLMERAEPYHLTVELARGLVNRLRNQSFEWELLGLQLPDALRSRLSDAEHRFAEAVTAGDESAATEHAEQAIDIAVEAAETLMQEYSRQALDLRHQQAPRLPTMLGASLGGNPLGEAASQSLLAAVNTAAISFRWSEIEKVAGKQEWEDYDRQVAWCNQQGLRLVAGPLLHPGARNIPEWLYLWEDDFKQIASYTAHHIETVVDRYRGKVQLWNGAAAMNVLTRIGLNEEHKMKLVVGAIDVVRRCDPETPLMISFDQPWGEYLAFEDLDLAPLHFADSLVRAELGVAAIGLELNLGYWPGGTLPRNRLDISRMLDRWSMLNLPLIIFLTIPSDESPAQKDAANGKRPLAALCDGPLWQKRLVEQLLPLLMAKSYVQGVIWNQLSDANSPDYLRGGLFDEQCRPKPALSVLAELRQEHLM